MALAMQGLLRKEATGSEAGDRDALKDALQKIAATDEERGVTEEPAGRWRSIIHRRNGLVSSGKLYLHDGD